jgi:hypothetical protein
LDGQVDVLVAEAGGGGGAFTGAVRCRKERPQESRASKFIQWV